MLCDIIHYFDATDPTLIKFCKVNKSGCECCTVYETRISLQYFFYFIRSEVAQLPTAASSVSAQNQQKVK